MGQKLQVGVRVTRGDKDDAVTKEAKVLEGGGEKATAAGADAGAAEREPFVLERTQARKRP